MEPELPAGTRAPGRPRVLVYLHAFLHGGRLGARPAFFAPKEPVAEPPGREETLSLMEHEIVAAARSGAPPGPAFPRPGDRFVLTTLEECREQPAEFAETVAGGHHVFMVLGWFASPADASIAIARAEEFLRGIGGVPEVEP